MLIFLLMLLTLLLAYLAYLLHAIVLCAKSVDENVKLIAERHVSSADDLSRIQRVMDLNFKQEREGFSEPRIEELLRSGDWIEAIKYRRAMSTDLVDDALSYVQRTAKRIGVAVPGAEKSEHSKLF